MTYEPVFLRNGPESAEAKLVLAHGAGAAMDSPFMEAFAEGLGERGVAVVRFEFAYMAARREGRRPGPDHAAILLQTWRDVVAALGDGPALFIGGKSMGGRMASMVADEQGVLGLICLGYPFHAIGRPETPRVEHLQTMTTRALIVQGTRDSFGTPEEVAGYALSPSIAVHWLEDGDHDFKPRSASGRTQRQNRDEAMDAVSAFVRE